VPHHYQGTVGNARERRKNDREKKKRKRENKMRAQKKGRRYSFFSFSLPSFLSSSIQYILTTYNSDPMDGLREIHFGERSLSLSHLYKNDSRRWIPLLPVVVVLFVVVVFDVPCCCWLCGDVGDTLWWELRAPRADDEPSTSKLK
jgi:hypothetical protein